MNALIAVAAFVFVLGVLVFVHELGHFLAAKSVGIAVLRFSLGLGPRTKLRFRKGETEYCVSWVPFGGYVKMAGLEDEGAAGSLEGPREEAAVPPERTFDHKPLWARAYVMLAGVTMNVLFAIFAFTLLAWRYGVTTDPTTTIGRVDSALVPMGAGQLETLRPGDRIIRVNGDTVKGWADLQRIFLTRTETPLRIEVAGRPQPLLVDVPLSESANRMKALDALEPWHDPVFGEVVPGEPAARAGLQTGDRILRVNGDTIPAWEVFVRKVEASANDTLRMAVQRGGQTLDLVLVPKPVVLPDSAGHRREVGKVVAGLFFPHETYGLIGAMGVGVQKAREAGGMVLMTLKGLLTLHISVKDLGGPVAIGKLSGQYARLGAEALLSFMALLSMNLAILNLLPIPVLDGGHLVFLFVEAIRRKPVSMHTREKLTTVGLVLLLVLMVFVTWNDILR